MQKNKTIDMSSSTIKPETKKKYTKFQSFMFYLGIVIFTPAIWAVIFGTLASVTTVMLSVATMIQSVAVAVGVATPLVIMYLIHNHRNRK